MWSYDPNLTTAKDRVRFMVGDTDTNDQLLQDGEINYLLTQEANESLAASRAAEAIAAKFARQADESVGDFRVSLSQKSQHYLELAAKLAKRGEGVAVPFAGGINESDRDSESDTSLVQPLFKRGMIGDE